MQRKKKPRNRYHIFHQNYFKMDDKLKCKMQNSKIFRRNIEVPIVFVTFFKIQD